MTRAVVNVSTGQYVRGAARLGEALKRHGGAGVAFACWSGCWPDGSPSHQERPFAFKAHALQAAAEGFDTLLWCDACMLPIRDMRPLWERIERDGYYIHNNGWLNGEWTAESAYQHLGVTPEENWGIKHVVAGIFGIDVSRPIGRRILDEYARLARTGAFRGPFWNSKHPEYRGKPGAAPCGPPTVRGHRHDQTALSVIAWREGCRLVDSPEVFKYGRATDPQPLETMVLADAGY